MKIIEKLLTDMYYQYYLTDMFRLGLNGKTLLFRTTAFTDNIDAHAILCAIKLTHLINVM